MFTRWLLLAATMVFSVGAMAQGSSVTLPWSENFDSYTTTGGATMPTGWNRVAPFQAVSSSAVCPNLTTASSHGTVLQFMGQGSSYDGTPSGVMKIATPLIPAPLNAIEISFQVYKSGLTVYLATDPTDESTYTLVGSYSPGWSWTTVEVRTDTLTGAATGQGYIVFCGNFGASGYSTAYVDNLSVVSLNNCERPTEVSVDNITPTSAVLSWPAVAGVTSYLVYYGTSDNMTAASQETVSGTSLLVDELEPGTDYYVWVKSICGPTSESDARTTTFTTQLSCYSMVGLQQVSAGFDAASFAWEFDARGNSATSVWTVLHDLTDNSEVGEASTGEMSHFVYGLDATHEYMIDFYTICGDDTAVAITLPVVFKVCGESALASLAHNYDMHPVPVGYNYGYAQMMYPADVFLDMDTIRGIALHRYLLGSGAVGVTRTLSIWMHNTADTMHNSAVSVTGMTQVVSDSSYTFPVQEWDTIYFSTPFVYTPGSNVILTIDDNTGSHVGTSAAQWMWHEQGWKTIYKNHDNTNPNPASVTGVTYTQRCPDMHFVGSCNTDMSCVAPIVAVSEVDSNNAVVNWIENSTNAYRVEYRTAGSAAWALAQIAYSSPVMLTDLQPATHYEVRVGVVCSDDDVRYSDLVTFTTECALMHIPFHFNQSDMLAAYYNGFTPCWHWSQYFFRHRLTDSNRGTVYNAGNGEWFMLPPIAEPLQGARLRTWAGSSDHGYIKVGIAGNENCSDVVWLDTIEVEPSDVNTSHTEYIAYLDGYTGTGNRVVVSPIVNNDYHYMFFFDFHVEEIEDCRPPVNLTLDSATATTLSVSWTPVGVATSWAVYVNGTQVGTASSTPHYTVNNRTPYTDYEVSVRALCGGGDTSNAVSAVFRTGCDGEQCTFTVSGVASSGEGWKGGYLVIMADSTVHVGTMKMLNGSTLDRTFSVCADMELSFHWMSGNADQECSFTITNANGQTLYTAVNALNLGRNFFVADSICDTLHVTPEPPAPVYYLVTVDYDHMRGEVTGEGTYLAGTQVTLRATPYEGYTFTGWGDGTTSAVYTFTLNSNVTLTANFESNSGIDQVGGMSLSLAPNPASGVVTVSGFDGMATVTFVDLNGREVYRKEAVSAGEKINLEKISQGVYFVRIVNAAGYAVGKLVVR